MKKIWQRDIEQDIQQGRFVSHFFLILLSLALASWRGDRQGPGLFRAFRLFFVKDANFRDGLIRFAHLSLFLFPVFALCFYLGIAIQAQDPWLAFNIIWCSAVMMGLAIYFSRTEASQDYSSRLRSCLILALATIMTVFVIGTTSKQSYEAHIEIWLYMVLTGFTIVLSFRMGLMLALISAPLPLLFMVIHSGSADFGGFMECFGLISTYLLGSLLKWVSDSYAFQSALNEDLAKARQQEIQFLLDTIPQGLLMIDEDGHILPHYSGHTPAILEEESLLSQSFYEVMIKHCSMNDDKKDQAWQALMASLGQTALSYEVNEDSLPREVHFKDKFLRLTWTPKFSEDKLCIGFLITLLDVSREKQNERMLSIQKQRMAIIEELLSIQGEHRAQRYLKRCLESLMEIYSSLDPHSAFLEVPKTHKLALHTAKGEARTLGLRELSSALHLAENMLIELTVCVQELKRDKISAYRTQMKDCLETAGEYLSCWQRFHRHSSSFTLTHEGRKLQLTMEELLTIVADHEVQKTQFASQLFHKKLSQINRSSLLNFLDSYLESITNIAEKLGKSVPQLKIEGESILIGQETEVILDQILSHILSNQLDHGIESPGERARHGKSQVGVISFKAYAEGTRLILDIQDDGRGLDLDKLRSMGVAQKALPDHASAEVVAELIFRGGFSTAQSVTETSGRGVGMEAVRDILQRHGGHIALQLLASPDERFRPFVFHIEIPDAVLSPDKGATSLSLLPKPA